MRRIALISAITVQAALSQSAEVSEENLLATVKDLSSDTFQGRQAGYETAKKAADYIGDKLKEFGVQPLFPATGNNPYAIPFEFRGFREKGGLLKGYNVAGYVRGKTHGLNEKPVVLVAHFDGTGIESQELAPRIPLFDDESGDRIWNSADDNCSGVSVLLECARVLSKSEPGRTVIFAFTDADEFFLQGSRNIVRTLSDAKIQPLCAVNVEMVGRNPEKPLSVLCASSSSGWQTVLAEVGKSMPDLNKVDDLYQGFSHAAFIEKEIPAVWVFSGFTKEFHTPLDEHALVSGKRLAESARLVLAIVAEASKLTDMQFTRIERGTGKRFGLVGTDIPPTLAKQLKLEEGEGGILVTDVERGSVAEKAGLIPDDVIVEFNNSKIPITSAMLKLQNLIQACRPGEDIPIIVIRKDRKIKLNARWPEK